MKIAKFAKGIVSRDGQLVRFEAHAHDGKIEHMEIPVKNIGDTIAFLAGLAQFAARKKTPQQLAADHAQGQHQGPLIEALRIGLAQGRTPHEKVLAFQIGDFSLGFAVEASQLGPLLQALAQIAPKEPPRKH